MTCNICVESLTAGWGFFQWMFLYLAINCICLYMLWRPKWFESHMKALLPFPQTLFFTLKLVLTILNAWAAFELWHCKNWDVDCAPLFLSVFTFVLLSVFPLVVMLTEQTGAHVITALAAFGLALGFTIVAWKQSTFAGAVGLIDVIEAIIYFFFAFSVWMRRPLINSIHDKSKTP